MCQHWFNGFDRHGSFSFHGIGLGRNVIIFEVDRSSSVHVDNKKKYILILGKGFTQALEHTLSAEKMYSIDRWILAREATNLKFYDFSSNFVWSMGPTNLACLFDHRHLKFIMDMSIHCCTTLILEVVCNFFYIFAS